MAFGGGLYTTQNKILPGAYFKFRSAPSANVTFSERGIVAVPMVLNWQPDEMIYMENLEQVDVTSNTAQWARDCKKVFGYNEGDSELAYIREIFANASQVFIYPLGSATKATCTYGTAKNGGVRGNDISLVISKNVDNPAKFDVITKVALETVDTQTVASAKDLVDNDFVVWKKDATLAVSASTVFEGGANVKATGTDYQKALDAFENIAFNILICPVADDETKAIFAAWTKRMNEQVGHYCQMVVYDYAADSEYVINVGNAVEGDNPAALTYYVGGEQAGCPVQSVCDNNTYLGELTIKPAATTQKDLATAMQAGKYVYHQVGQEWRVLADNNSLTSFTADKDEAFSRNQTMRVLQQRANDCTEIFVNDFLGKAGTTDLDRANYKMRIVAHAEYLQSIGAIRNYDSKDTVVEAGDAVDSYHVVESLQPNYAVRKIYHDITVAAFQG